MQTPFFKKHRQNKTAAASKLKHAALYIGYCMLLLVTLRFSYYYCFEDNSPVTGAIVMFLDGLALILFSVSVILLIKDALDSAKAEQEVRTLKQKVTLNQAHAAEVASLRATARDFQEEMTFLLASISASIAREDYISAETAFSDFQKRFQELPYHSYCADGLLNTILLQKEQAAAKLGIDTAFHILVHGSLQLEPVTITSLFTNLLDNGMEACAASRSTKPFIDLTVKSENSYLLIQMINSKDPDVKFNKTSTKENTAEHGFGLSLMEEIAHETDGSCEWTDLGHRFVSTIMLHIG